MTTKIKPKLFKKLMSEFKQHAENPIGADEFYIQAIKNQTTIPCLNEGDFLSNTNILQSFAEEIGGAIADDFDRAPAIAIYEFVQEHVKDQNDQIKIAKFMLDQHNKLLELHFHQANFTDFLSPDGKILIPEEFQLPTREQHLG